MKFLNAKEMLEYIQSGVDIYSKKASIYLYLYNDCGSICYYSVDFEEANELAEKSRKSDEYWGAFLGIGGQIYDDPSYTGFKQNHNVSNLDLCKELIKYDDWINADEI